MIYIFQEHQALMDLLEPRSSVSGHAGCAGNTGATGHMGSAGAPGNNMSLDIIARMRD